MLLTLIVGQNPDQTNVFGYNQARPAFGALTPRKVVGDNDTLITQFITGSTGDIIVKCAKPILGATPTLTSVAGISVQLTFAADGYTGNSADFVASITAHNEGTFNVEVDTVTTKSVSDPVASLDNMTKPELITYANTHNIIIDESGLKADILAAIQGA